MKPILSILVALVLMISTSVAQDVQEINGSKTPELIPDNVAYLHFFMLMRQLPPPHWDLPTKLDFLNGTGLTEPDVQKIVKVADDYFEKIKPLEAQVKQVTDMFQGRSPDEEALLRTSSLVEQEKLVLEGQVTTLLTEALSMEAALKLKDFLPLFKRGIIIHVGN